MTTPPRPERRTRAIAFLIALGLLAPPAAHFVIHSIAPGIERGRAMALAHSSSSGVALLDIRPAESFSRFHLPQSQSLPFSGLMNISRSDLEKMTGGATAIIISDTGLAAALAAFMLNRRGFANVYFLEGGLEGWLAAGKVNPGAGAGDDTVSSGRTVEFSLLSQVLLVFSAYVLKPIYELAALAIVIILWSAAAEDLAAVRRSMAAFFLGETACAVNFLFFNETSALWEYFHSYGMLVCFGFIAYAVMEAANARIIRYSRGQGKCALLSSCGFCYKVAQTRCSLYLLFLVLAPSMAALALAPMAGPIRHQAVSAQVFGANVVFSHPLTSQLLEGVVFPAAAFIFLMAGFAALALRKEDGLEEAKILVSIGAGPMAFSLLRFALHGSFSENPLWADIWEELTEFMFVAAVFMVVYSGLPGKSSGGNMNAGK